MAVVVLLLEYGHASRTDWRTLRACEGCALRRHNKGAPLKFLVPLIYAPVLPIVSSTLLFIVNLSSTQNRITHLVLLSYSTNKETTLTATRRARPVVPAQAASPSVRLSRTARPHAAHGHDPHACGVLAQAAFSRLSHRQPSRGSRTGCSAPLAALAQAALSRLSRFKNEGI
ncbi:hypothetical protein Syun_019162 [Stephania yunnanensis]|uniref:Uncharacterized protein n=1 Tax=Stephania yunnanensis TaxID=152371 RepID=A0AAP0IUR3_9MAGN